MKPKTPRSLKSRALQLLAQREQSRVELRRKLLAHAHADADADAESVALRDRSGGAEAGAGANAGRGAVVDAEPVVDAEQWPRARLREAVGVADADADAEAASGAEAAATAEAASGGEAAADAEQPAGAACGPRSAATAGVARCAGGAVMSAPGPAGAAELAGPARAAGPADSNGGLDAATRVEGVLAWLDSQGFLSDERFAESRINARAGRFGDLRIRQELKQHGVALDADAARSLRESEASRAWAVWERRFGTALPGSAAEAARQARFLSARGFSPDSVRQVLRRARCRHGSFAATAPDDD